MARQIPPSGPPNNVIDLEEFRNRFGAESAFGRFIRGGLFRKLLGPIILIYLAFKVFTFLCFTYVGPNEYGIKVVRLSVLPWRSRGVGQERYEAGFHFVLRPFGAEEMYRFPRDLQVFDLTGAKEEASRDTGVTQAARIQTSDGFFVDVDASILYKIFDPYKTFTGLGPGRAFEAGGMMPKAEPVLKQTFGELTTEGFFNSSQRSEKAQKAKEILNGELAQYGMQVDQVLVRYFRYTAEIQKNIEEKKLKDQLVFKNQAEGRAAAAGAKLKKMIQEGQATIEVKLQEGRAYVTRKEAERDLYVRKKKAEADLLVRLADAQKTQLRNDALQGAGSDRMIGLKMADVYKGLEIIVLPSDGANGVNPLNLGQNMKLFEVAK